MRCFMCEEIKEDGLFLAGYRLCIGCEERILYAEPEEAEAYDEVVEGVRRFWNLMIYQECEC